MNRLGKLRNLFFLLATVSGAFLCVQDRCIADQYVLQILPTDDTFVDNAEPNQPFGGESELYIGNRLGGGGCRAYLRFDISGIPEGVTIVDAELVLTISGESECNVSAHNVSDCSWTEDSVTWNNAPVFDPPGATVNVFFLSASAYSFAWSVTPDLTLAYNELDSGGAYCTMLKLQDELVDVYVVAESKESSDPAKPYLEVTYVPEPMTMGLIGLGGLVLFGRRR